MLQSRAGGSIDRPTQLGPDSRARKESTDRPSSWVRASRARADADAVRPAEHIHRRCSRYHIRGDKAGTVARFTGSLPGYPDNIRYDGEGRYWIALSAGRTLEWEKTGVC
ncbi:hypothetical protein QYE76_012430 [Lolium multiflorum]|uniref:Strictosidine synthase n=1 Tax=Lolium multiflorum TaxID=4521 RepID=A0AAD8X3N3_LOLMU|nr:hypothetical protein QYE76_012430 [Lolium multiflorum]